MQVTTPSVAQPVPVAAEPQSKATGRLFFVDNIRVLLTIQVLLFHLMIIYAGTGGWSYKEGREDFVTSVLGAWFIIVSQAFFMGLFLLISAYFVPGSYDRKGASRFLRDRLIRLGIPLAIFSWVIWPPTVYVIKVVLGQPPASLASFVGDYVRDEGVIGTGPLWFVETLLIFSLVYVLWRVLTQGRPPRPAVESRFPGNGTIGLLALLLGLGSFGVRQWFTLDYNFQILNLKFPFFLQYIVLFVIGLVAYRRNWLLNLPDHVGRFWLTMAIVLVFLLWPMVLISGLDQGLDPFKGGWHWQTLAYAVWESFLCVGMCIGLIYAMRRYANRQGRVAGFLAHNAYTAYIIHGTVITLMALAVREVTLYPLLKWALMALLAVPLCFGLSSLIRKLPYTERVL